MVLNIPTSRMQGKMQTFEQQYLYKCFILWYFTYSQIWTNIDLICQKWDLYYSDALNSLHITKAVDYTDLFIGKKKTASLRSTINCQFEP